MSCGIDKGRKAVCFALEFFFLDEYPFSVFVLVEVNESTVVIIIFRVHRFRRVVTKVVFIIFKDHRVDRCFTISRIYPFLAKN